MIPILTSTNKWINELISISVASDACRMLPYSASLRLFDNFEVATSRFNEKPLHWVSQGWGRRNKNGRWRSGGVRWGGGMESSGGCYGSLGTGRMDCISHLFFISPLGTAQIFLTRAVPFYVFPVPGAGPICPRIMQEPHNKVAPCSRQEERCLQTWGNVFAPASPPHTPATSATHYVYAWKWVFEDNYIILDLCSSKRTRVAYPCTNWSHIRPDVLLGHC